MNDLQYLALSAGLLFLQLLSASLIRARAWTLPGMLLALGNREAMPEVAPAVARADRAAKNMLENLVLLVAVHLAARASGATAEQLAPGAALFFWARVVYVPLYVLGIPYLRTVAWGVALGGVLMMARFVF